MDQQNRTNRALPSTRGERSNPGGTKAIGIVHCRRAPLMVVFVSLNLVALTLFQIAGNFYGHRLAIRHDEAQKIFFDPPPISPSQSPQKTTMKKRIGTVTTKNQNSPLSQLSSSGWNTTAAEENNVTSNKRNTSDPNSTPKTGAQTFSLTAFFAKFGIHINVTDDSTWPVLASTQQVENLHNDERLGRYEAAMTLLQAKENRTLVDPLGAKNFVVPKATNRLPFKPKVQYLGVLVDAGRHYFPINWLKRLIQYLYRLRFNLLHLRLTDDQAFNVRLKSYPELAAPSPTAPNNATYTPHELQSLVKFARQYDISIIPEINLPGHSGAWSGIANLTVHCPRFACSVGYGIPLNINHPQIKTILMSVLKEVIQIFDNPPFLHLGGDEVYKSADCFAEAGLPPFSYEYFENDLEDIIKTIKYPIHQVIRWEVTGPNVSLVHKRAGMIQQNWYNLPGTKLAINPNHTYMSSCHLYMDNNNDDGAAQIVLNTIENFQLDKNGTDHNPVAIIPAAFELDSDMWMQRNVAARLIAVAMGAAHLHLTQPEEIMREYEKFCRCMDLHPTVCNLQGYTTVPNWKYKKGWKKVWQNWIQNGTCVRSGGKPQSTLKRNSWLLKRSSRNKYNASTNAPITTQRTGISAL